MARSKGEGSVSRRKNGLWIVRFQAGTKPDGSPRVIQAASMSHDEVMTKLNDLRSQYRTYGYIGDRTVTVTGWTERWLNEIAKPKLRPDTWSSYASLMRKHVQPSIGNRKMVDLSPGDIRTVRIRMMQPDPKTGQPCSSSTVLKCYRVLSRCIEDARREGIVTVNVAANVDPPKKAISAKGSFTIDQVRALLGKATDDPMHSRYTAALLMGVRQSETIGLTLDHLDLDAGVAKIAWQLQEIPWDHTCGERGAAGIYPCGFKQAARCPAKVRRVPDGYDYRMLEGNFALVPTKSRSTPIRYVPVIPPLVAALRKHIAATAHIPNPHNLVWRQADGSPIPHHLDQEGWRGLVESIGLPRTCTTHWARHSVATLLMEAGVDAKVVGEIVGHGSVAMTQAYQHVSSQLAKDAMGKLDALLTVPAEPAPGPAQIAGAES